MFMRENLLKIRKNDPEKFKKIIDTECPHLWGLPSFNDDGRCTGESKCHECWQEALNNEHEITL